MIINNRIGLIFCSFALVSGTGLAADKPVELVDLAKIDFTIKQSKCILRRPVAVALSRAQTSLKLGGFGLMAVMCYVPGVDKKSVAKGPDGVDDSTHARGGSVNLTMIQGPDEALMPKFLAGGPKDKIPGSDSDRTRIADKNLKRLKTVMEKEGFKNSQTGWWHFNYKDSEKFESSNVPLSAFE